jgi:hypothetical protein
VSYLGILGAEGLLTDEQEGWLAANAADEEDRMATEQANNRAEDPMQGLEGLDVAGPKPE